MDTRLRGYDGIMDQHIASIFFSSN